MADDLTISGVGTVAADVIDGIAHQRVKVEFGADGSATDVSTSDPLPVGGSLLTGIDSDTSTLAAAVVSTNAIASGSATGLPEMAIRDDTLSDLGVADGDWAPKRVNQRGATWVAMDTVLDASNDSVALDARSGVGYDGYHSVSLAAKAQVKGTAGTVGGYFAANKHATEWRYVRFYDAASASVTVGTTATAHVIPLPPASAATRQVLWKFATGITVAAQKDQGDSGTTAADANDVILDLDFK